VWAWGENSSWQLGHANANSQPIPQRVATLSGIRAVAAGNFHSLALDADGGVWAWGDNHRGALGENAPNRSATPVRVPGLPSIQAVAAGWDTSMALAVDGTVWSWGATIGEFSFSPTAHQVAGLEGIRGISVDGHGALAVDEEGRVWGWGSNNGGRFGTGLDSTIPAPIHIEGPTDVIAATLGASYVLAITATGAVWEWGIGPSFGGAPLDPQLVTELSEGAAVAVGNSHALVVLPCGQVWAWGNNDHRQVGPTSGEPESVVHRPRLVVGIGDDQGCASAGLRILLGGDAPVPPHDIGMIGDAPWNGTPLTRTADRGTTLAVSLNTPIHAGAQFAFARWAGDCIGVDPQIDIVLDRSKVCTAVYERISLDPMLLRVISDGGAVHSEPFGLPPGPNAIECGDKCEAIFRHGAAVELTATPAAGFAFSSWDDGCSGTLPQTTIVMDEPSTCVARFRAYQLDVSVTGMGRVISEPAGIDCGSLCSSTPRVGTTRLIAMPDPGWRLASWGGDCTGSTTALDVSMDGDRQCTATFVRIDGMFFLTVTVDGQGEVTSQPAGIACPGSCSALFAAGTEVVLTAQPASGWELSFWLDGCASVNTPTRAIVMDADKTCRARFTGQLAIPVASFLSSTIVGTAYVGEVVTFNGLTSHLFDPVTGTQDPAGISSLAWDLDNDGQFDDAFGGRATAGIAQHAFQTVGSFPIRLRVVGGPFDFDDVEEQTITVLPASSILHGLTVSKGGNGQGSISTTPPGLLSCAATCTQFGPLLLDPSASITLVAQPAPGSAFVGWSGSECTGTTPAITVSMAAARFCTASFELDQFLLTVSSSAGGTLTSAPPGIACGSDCSEVLPIGTTVVLTAAPDAGLAIDSWSGCDSVTADTCTVTMLSSRTVGVTFVPLAGPFTLTVMLSGPAGSPGRVISIAPAGAINCGLSFGSACAVTLPANTPLLIRPDDLSLENNLFLNWSGCDAVGTLFACSVTLTGNRTIVATFRP
jgi:hypothetical protein